MGFKKTFRIVKNNLSEEAANSFHPLKYRIEQRFTFIPFVHFWDAPLFAPPHSFETAGEAVKYICDNCKNARVIIDECDE